MSVFPFLNGSEISRCVTDSLAQSADETDVRLAKLIRRTRQSTPDNWAASLSRVTADWEARVSAAAHQCRERPAGTLGD
jgi:hypothetical protein